MRLFHCTHKRNVGSIRRWGIIPRDTSKHNYPGLHVTQGPVERVYCAEWPWFWGNPNYGYVCVEFEAEGLTIELDRALGNAKRIVERVTPDRIIAVHKDFGTLPRPVYP